MHACDPHSAGLAAAVCRTATCQQMCVLSLNAATHCYADLTGMTCSLAASRLSTTKLQPLSGADVKLEISKGAFKRLPVMLTLVCC